MSNLPPGTTQRDIDKLCQASDSTPHRFDCMLCSREIEQCDDTQWFFFTDEFTHTKPTHRCDFTDAFETHAGWVCSTACWNDHALDENCEPEAEPAKLFLVGGAR